MPLNFMAVRAAQSLVHPRTFGTVDGGLPADMWLAFLVCFAGITALWVTLVCFELTAKRTKAQISRLRRALDDRAPASSRRRRADRSRRRGGPLMPALPLDEAGKYVAAAYVVFVLLLVVYIGIMAAKLGRISRRARGARRARREAAATEPPARASGPTIPSRSGRSPG